MLPPVVEQVVVEVLAADHPEARQWPDELEPYINAVAAASGPFRFEAATVELVNTTQMAAQLEADIPDMTQLPADVAEAVRRYDDVHRALGIATIDFDVLASNRATARQIEGLYDQSQHRILLRVASLDEELSPDQQQLLVHELVHAWQGPERVRQLAAIGADLTVARALIEGEAERIATDWRAAQAFAGATPPVEQAEVEAPQAASLIADTLVHYALGRRLHRALDQVGGVDAVMAANSQVGGSALVDPYRWLDGRPAEVTLAAPSVEAATGAGLPVVAVPMSAPHWLQVFASAVPLPDAILAARAVQSTSTPTTWIEADGSTCVAVAVAGTTEAFAEALAQWQAALPDYRSATLKTDNAALQADAVVQACDPGSELVPPPVTRADDAVRGAALVIDSEQWAVDRGEQPQAGACRALVLLGSGQLQPTATASELLAALDRFEASSDCT